MEKSQNETMPNNNTTQQKVDIIDLTQELKDQQKSRLSVDPETEAKNAEKQDAEERRSEESEAMKPLIINNVNDYLKNHPRAPILDYSDMGFGSLDDDEDDPDLIIACQNLNEDIESQKDTPEDDEETKEVNAKLPLKKRRLSYLLKEASSSSKENVIEKQENEKTFYPNLPMMSIAECMLSSDHIHAIHRSIHQNVKFENFQSAISPLIDYNYDNT